MDYIKDIRYKVIKRLLYFILIASIFSIVSNIFNDRDVGIVFIPVAALFVIILVLLIMKKRPYLGKIIFLFIFNIIVLPVIWVFSPGIASAASSYAIMTILLSTLFVEKKIEFLFPAVSTVLSVCMIRYELINPTFFVPFPSKRIQVNDVTINFMIVVIITSIAIVYVNRYYEKEKDRIYNISIRDQLTGIYNRRYFFEYGEQAYADFLRFARVFSVAMIDIDFFKKVNDQYGHYAGDEYFGA